MFAIRSGECATVPETGEIVVLAPTRGRPERAEDLVASFRGTVHLFSTSLILVVDRNDPEIERYLEIPGRHRGPAGGQPLSPPDPVHVMVLAEHETGNLTKATNSAARRVWDDDLVIGHVGDDHLFRTPGWDRVVLAHLRSQPGVLYGNDLNVRELLPTAPFINAIIPRTLGWYALPTCHHMYIDNAWKQIGQGIGRLIYLDDLIIEHMHPSVRKAKPDAGYLLADSSLDHDRIAFEAWMKMDYAEDLERVRRALA
jgi:hypothetical protein